MLTGGETLGARYTIGYTGRYRSCRQRRPYSITNQISYTPPLANGEAAGRFGARMVSVNVLDGRGARESTDGRENRSGSSPTVVTEIKRAAGTAI